MRVLVDDVTIGNLSQLIDRDTHADYVYMYPPRQVYRPFEMDDLPRVSSLTATSLARFDELNLYIHVPFCKQICSFCNLYTTNDTGRDLQTYIDAVLNEASTYAQLTDRKHIQTLYLGGGTPSLLSPSQIEQLINRMLALFSNAPHQIPPETALEVDPATVNATKLRDLLAAGVNRINLGYQSLVEREVAQLGRKRSEDAGLHLLEQALSIGFANVCVDLIYGLQHQTDDTWRTSVEQVVSLSPPTICAYALTLRPFTGYDRRGYTDVNGGLLYRRFEMADQILHDAGYRRETHVRWVKDGGGYMQKANHWGMQNILSFGAGARSYLWELDYRNGYSVRTRSATLKSYLDNVANGRSSVSDGYLMTRDEQMRKAATLNVQSLDRQWFSDLFGVDPVVAFNDEYAVLKSLGLCKIEASQVSLTELAGKYRDLIAQCFFSPTIRHHLKDFNYDE